MAEGNEEHGPLAKDLDIATNINEKEGASKHVTLTGAKDRAQVAASTAMSVVNVALLKAVLDRGPVDNPYYWLSLGLICTALALQIVAGLLSIWVSQLVGYMDKYGEGNMIDVLCPCHCVKNKPERRTTRAYYSPDRAARREEHIIPTATVADKPADPEYARVSEEEVYMLEVAGDPDACCSCCGSSCVTGYPEHEHKMMRRYHEWRQYIMDREIIDLDIKEEMELQDDMEAKLKATVQDCEEQIQSSRDEAEKAKLTQDLEKAQADMKEAQDRKRALEVKLSKLREASQEGEKLTAYAKSVQKIRMMKMVTFYQNLINYIFYVVLILNTFITGFGINVDTPAATNGVTDGGAATSAPN